MGERCACGKKNDVIHTKTCHIGGYINLRHDSIRNFIHQRASMAYKDTEVEPKLRSIAEQSLNPGANKAEQARTDIRINTFE